jgi:hypothetical protein
MVYNVIGTCIVTALLLHFANCQVEGNSPVHHEIPLSCCDTSLVLIFGLHSPRMARPGTRGESSSPRVDSGRHRQVEFSKIKKQEKSQCKGCQMRRVRLECP